MGALEITHDYALRSLADARTPVTREPFGVRTFDRGKSCLVSNATPDRALYLSRFRDIMSRVGQKTCKNVIFNQI